MNTLAIIGGGAAGLAAAVESARCARQRGADLRVVVYEADQKVGRSILRSGNGRCNFSNAGISAWDEGALAELYCNGGFVAQVLQELERSGKIADPADDVPLDAACNQVLAFFRSLGLAWRVEGEGRMYPYANKAQSLLDALRAAMADLGVEVRLEALVSSVEPPRSAGGPVTLRMADGSFERAGQVIVAVGGTLGSELLGDAAEFLPTRPVLGPLAALPLFEGAAAGAGQACGVDGRGASASGSGDFAPSSRKARAKGKGRKKGAAAEPGASAVLNGLDNIRVRCTVALARPGRDGGLQPVAQESGEVLFRKYGLSGIAVFNLSRFAQPGDVLQVDLLPELSLEQATAWLLRRCADAGTGGLAGAAATATTTADMLQGFLLPNVARAVCLAAGERADAPARSADAAALAAACKGLAFQVQGVGDVKQCQVHAGGVDVSQVSPRTLQLASCSQIRVVGEALDIDAPCGGYNLHWAWASGLLAARSAAADL
ncbi:MAG: FAD-dependent oxidoreductase [Coriobacteriia bacterium]|nr:FAD-dependent oxidoreductase [Coriobacteriia bacterium]